MSSSGWQGSGIVSHDPVFKWLWPRLSEEARAWILDAMGAGGFWPLAAACRQATKAQIKLPRKFASIASAITNQGGPDYMDQEEFLDEYEANQALPDSMIPAV